MATGQSLWSWHLGQKRLIWELQQGLQDLRVQIGCAHSPRGKGDGPARWCSGPPKPSSPQTTGRWATLTSAVPLFASAASPASFHSVSSFLCLPLSCQPGSLSDPVEGCITLCVLCPLSVFLMDLEVVVVVLIVFLGIEPRVQNSGLHGSFCSFNSETRSHSSTKLPRPGSNLPSTCLSLPEWYWDFGCVPPCLDSMVSSSLSL